MIEIIGIEGSHEYTVALAIRDAFVSQWPGIDKSPEAEEIVKIVANAKLAGYQVSDIDVVVGAVFNRARHFVVRKPIKDKEGKSVSGVRARVQNFVCAIEVKSQDASGVNVNGDEVSVRYQGKWKSATDQNVKQVHALRSYFEDQYIECFVFRCLVLDGIDRLPNVGGLARPEAGAVAGGFSAGDFLASIAGVNGIGKWSGEHVVFSARAELMRKVLAAPIFKQVVPTRLDRIRMDRIAARRDEADQLAALLGKQRVHVRGHGGTGKTVMMMQAAHVAYQKHGRRCLVLTYNVALAGDITRLLFLLGVPSSYEGGGVEVRTAMSFVYRWLSRLGLIPTDEAASYDDYEKRCAECLALIEGGAISRTDIETIVDADLEELGFDAIIVDEAQDWPQPEARLLAAIYGGERISIADGREQLLRGAATDWSRTLAPGQGADERDLTHCLRMKRNLGLFANTVARLAGLNWEVEPSDQAAGGKVIILSGSYGARDKLVEKLVREASEAGNDKVDFLHCVPPGNVIERDGVRRSRLASELERLGHSSWDAVEERIRSDFPRSNDVFRVVQYESSRGLEGWTTILEGFDEAWSWKNKQERARYRALGDRGPTDPARAARLAAWRWSMIPLTRPIDTLVLALDDLTNPVTELVLHAAKVNPDFVEILG